MGKLKTYINSPFRVILFRRIFQTFLMEAGAESPILPFQHKLITLCWQKYWSSRALKRIFEYLEYLGLLVFPLAAGGLVINIWYISGFSFGDIALMRGSKHASILEIFYVYLTKSFSVAPVRLIKDQIILSTWEVKRS